MRVTTTREAEGSQRSDDARAQRQGQGLPGSPQQQAWRDVIAAGAPSTPGWAVQLKADPQADRGRGVALPAALRSGIEALSGLSMDAVRVHYDSPRPASVGAHAYAQGTEIHLASRQEQHLGHEAWHVVQQMQGRVRPDAQVGGVDIAASPALEAEADTMGGRALRGDVDMSARTAPPIAAAAPAAAPVQRVERKTSIYNKVPQTNDYNKNMEIVDSTSPSVYVHLSRDAAGDGASVNIQQQPNFFNGRNEGNKRTQIEEGVDDNAHFDLAAYTVANNVHVTLEGRYALVMSQLANGVDNLDNVKIGPPVADGYANLNFGSYAAHNNYTASDKSVYAYIDQYAEDAEEIVRNREETYDGQKEELVQQIDKVKDDTRAFTDYLIASSDLSDLTDADFVHYGGEPWDPLIPADLQ